MVGELSACAKTQPALLCSIPPFRPRIDLSTHAASRRTSVQPAAAAQTLHELPEEILRAIMSHLVGNEAVKLASLHPALRRALRTLPSLEASVVLDVSMTRDRARTRQSKAQSRRGGGAVPASAHFDPPTRASPSKR